MMTFFPCTQTLIYIQYFAPTFNNSWDYLGLDNETNVFSKEVCESKCELHFVFKNLWDWPFYYFLDTRDKTLELDTEPKYFYFNCIGILKFRWDDFLKFCLVFEYIIL